MKYSDGLLVAAVALTIQSCTNEPAALPRSVLRTDSAGIAIITLREDPWQSPTWATIDTTNAFRIIPDNSVPATLFGRVRGALKLSDGSIAVLDAGNFEIRIFGKTGGHIRSIGRSGHGPGEFEQPWRLMRGRDDSLVVYDFSGSIQIFARNSDGGASRLLKLPWTSSTGNAQILGTFDDGSYLAIMNDFMREPVAGRNPLFSSLYAMTARGDTGVALGKQISTERAFKDAGGGKVEEVEILFWAEPGWTALSDSYVWCSPERFVCDVWSNRGGQLRSVRAPVSTQPVTDAAKAELTRRRLVFARTQSDSARVRAAIADSYNPSTYPILALIRSDSRDRIWMREFPRHFDQKVALWVVFDAGGSVYGTVELPADLQVYDIGVDYILGVEPDDNDVQVPVIYRYSTLSARE